MSWTYCGWVIAYSTAARQWVGYKDGVVLWGETEGDLCTQIRKENEEVATKRNRKNRKKA